jgi:hypothetical protein
MSSQLLALALLLAGLALVLLGRHQRRAARRHTPAYRQFLASAAWQRMRVEVLSRAGGRCQRAGWFGLFRCGQAATDVHHRRYPRWGAGLEAFERQSPRDLVALCRDHHHRADRERRQHARAR